MSLSIHCVCLQKEIIFFFFKQVFIRTAEAMGQLKKERNKKNEFQNTHYCFILPFRFIQVSETLLNVDLDTNPSLLIYG